MSLESWKAEFYPIDAKDVSIEAAPAHALLKWIGYRDENLAKHGLVRISEYAIGEYNDDTCSSFTAGYDECALCVHYLIEEEDEYGIISSSCTTCPIYKLTRYACGHEESIYSDLSVAYEDGSIEYALALENMIALLRRVVAASSSSNGRTADFDSVNGGSTPSEETNKEDNHGQ